MSWQDREYASDEGRGFGRPGGDWQGMRPSFDNPFSWSLLLGRVGGISVRVHILFLIFVIVMLLRSLVRPEGVSSSSFVPLGMTALAMTVLFVIVLVHEFGHCLACRWSGGAANEILMWPLGGLAYCRPLSQWKSHFVTAVGGPMVNVVFCIIAGCMLGITTGHWLGVALPNPLHPFASALHPTVQQSWAHITLAIINEMSLLLLLFNLLPIFPLDGGRIVQALTWPKIGYVKSMRAAVRIGYIGAIFLGIFGIVMSYWMVVAIALFGGITCYITHKQLQMSGETLGFEDDEYALSTYYEDDAGETPQSKRQQRRAQRETMEAEEVDRILKKIGDVGMDGLTRREKKLLQRVSNRKREDE